MPDKKIVLLAQAGESTNILFHAVQQQHPIAQVILESPESKSKFIKRRARRLGWFKVLGQLLFMVYQRVVLQPATHNRQAAIKQQYGLQDGPIPAHVVRSVHSCNSQTCRDLLRKIQPDLTLINGPRIIGKKTIASANCPMVNIHAGITPKYRGVHGGYWALRNQEPALCGVSLHIIDEGIDTGHVLDQALIQPTDQDGFTTYPVLQLAEGLRLLKQHLPALLQQSYMTTTPMTAESKLWYHPTLWGYLSSSVR